MKLSEEQIVNLKYALFDDHKEGMLDEHKFDSIVLPFLLNLPANPEELSENYYYSSLQKMALEFCLESKRLRQNLSEVEIMEFLLANPAVVAKMAFLLEELLIFCLQWLEYDQFITRVIKKESRQLDDKLRDLLSGGE